LLIFITPRILKQTDPGQGFLNPVGRATSRHLGGFPSGAFFL